MTENKFNEILQEYELKVVTLPDNYENMSESEVRKLAVIMTANMSEQYV